MGVPLLGVQGRLRDWAGRFSRWAFVRLDRYGVHILPKRYYSSIPDYTWLEAHPAAWRDPVPIVGVEWDLEKQLLWLRQTCKDEYLVEVPIGRFQEGTEAGPGFPPIDSQLLHCFVRSYRPQRILEIGGGHSTAVMVNAADLNTREGLAGSDIVTVEPFPAPGLLRLEGVTVIREPAQLVDESVFERLQTGDLLFIDSTHAVKTGSEVLRLLLQVIPSLPEGIYVHIHDVTLPYLYGRTFGQDFFDPQETSLILALLIHNEHLRVLACSSALNYERPDELRKVFPGYLPMPPRTWGLGTKVASGMIDGLSMWLVTT
jgi:hypothetical protein